MIPAENIPIKKDFAEVLLLEKYPVFYSMNRDFIYQNNLL